MIDRQYNSEFHLVCDVCGQEAPEVFQTFEGAVDYKYENSWRSQKTARGWEDVCASCLDAESYF